MTPRRISLSSGACCGGVSAGSATLALVATIDLNADVGEGAGDDRALIPLVTSVNVSGGAHAGDRDTIARAIELAVAHGVVIGAHPGYPDREYFGRRTLPLAPDALHESVAAQLQLVRELAQAAGARVAYVKPHGALYHAVTADRQLAATVDAAIAAVDASLPLLLAPGAAQRQLAARRGAPAFAEGFADRGYVAGAAGLTLAPRGEPGATLSPEQAAVQARRLARHGEVIDLAGVTHRLAVDSLCLHGDSPGAPQAASAIRDALAADGMVLAPFAG